MRTTQTTRFGGPKSLCLLFFLSFLCFNVSNAQESEDSSTCAIDTFYLQKRKANALLYRVSPAFDSLEYRYTESSNLDGDVPDSLWMTGTASDSIIVPITGLESETVYGVQLRVWCADSATYSDWTETTLDTTRCLPPDDEALSMIEVTYSTAEMGCNINSAEYEWVLRKVGYFTWRHVQSSNGHMKWYGLDKNCAYEWQVRVKCGDDWSDYTSPQGFWTSDYAPVCEPPKTDHYHAGGMDHNSVKLTCSMDGHAFIWAVVKDGSHTWSTYETKHGSMHWGNLHSGSRYGYKVKVKCPNGLWSDWSDVKYFTTTTHCATPTHGHISVHDVSHNYAKTHCDMAGHEYHWAIRRAGKYEWHHFTTTTKHHGWNNLWAGTKYEFKVKVKCHGGVWTGWSPVGWFSTHGQTCHDPSSSHVTIEDLSHDYVKLTCSLDGYEYHWSMRKYGSSNWTHKTTTVGHYPWKNLWHDTKYEFKVKVKCHNGYWSAWSPVKWFKTHGYGHCTTPHGSHLKVTNLSHDYAKTHCSLDGKEYHWSFRKKGSTNWHHKTTSHGSHGWSGLWENTHYEYKVKVLCHNGYWTDWSPVMWFVTKHHQPYCSTPHSSHIKVTDLSHNYAKTHCSVHGKEYHWSFRKLGSSNWTHKTTSHGSHGWTGLWENTKYEYKVKVLCHDGYWSNWSPTGWFTTKHYGPACTTPNSSHLTVTNLSHNYAKTHCSVQGKEYHWSIRKHGSSHWSHKSTSTPHHGWTGLWENTKYEYKVKVLCHNGHWTHWSGSKWFTTSHNSSYCSTPWGSEISVSNISYDRARTNCVVQAKEYHWAIRKHGASEWFHKTSSHSYHDWSNLWSNSKYEYKVKVLCHNGHWTGWSPVGYFTTHHYGSQSCSSPTASHTSVTDLSHSYAKTHCSISGAEYHWAVRKYGSSTWTHQTTSHGSHGWSGLWSDTEYEYKVKVKCHNGHWTSWSPVGWFRTHKSGYGHTSCSSPSGGEYTAKQEKWNLFRMHCYVSASKYEWAIRRSGHGWLHHTTSATNMGWGNLAGNTKYEYKVRITCHNGSQSNWSSVKSFWTGSSGSAGRSGEGDPVPYDYSEYIDDVSELTVYPNPTREEVRVAGVTAGQRIVLINSQGQTVLRTEVTQNQQLIDLWDIPSGVYHVVVADDEGEVANKRLIVTQ